MTYLKKKSTYKTYLQGLFFTPQIQYTHEKNKNIIKDQGKQDSTGCL